MHCCWRGRFEMVKLLVERYGADIEYVSCHDKTAIMYSATSHEEITKYLYDRGAQLKTSTVHIRECACPSIKKMVKNWEHDKFTQHNKILIKNINVMKLNFEKLLSLNDKLTQQVQNLMLDNISMKLNYEKVLNLTQNSR